MSLAAETAAHPPPTPGTPAYFQQAYDTTALSAIGGIGDTVAVVDAYDDPTAEADLAAYRSYFGLSPCTTANGCFAKVGQDGSSDLPTDTNVDWATEVSLDLDAVSAICPNCHIVLVEADSDSDSDLVAAEQSAAAIPGVDQISDSWMSNGPVGTLTNSDFSYPGIATLAAAGDSGWDGGATNTAWPAALPGVNAIGGTSVSDSQTSRGFTEVAWSDSGSGCAAEPKPAWQTDTAAADCSGRSYNDISAVADPYTGLYMYDSYWGGFSLWGGTSLATPMTAAYYAVVGNDAGDGDASWDYANASSLNAVASGNNGGGAACSPSYICNAGPGYSGPAGNGSISGDAAVGAPGIGGPDTADGYVQSWTSTTATLTAGIYSNGESTSYYVEYGPTTAYGRQTPTVTIPAAAGVTAVSVELSGLQTGANEQYRFVASNASGTIYGYNYDLAGSAPQAPTVDGIGTANLTLGTTTATVQAAIDPNGWATTYHFALGTSTSALSTDSPSTDAAVGSQASDQTVSQELTGLSPDTTYYVEVVATNAAGTTTSLYASFTTAAQDQAEVSSRLLALARSARPRLGTVASPLGISALAPSAAEATSLTDLTGLADASAIAAVDDVCGSPTLGQAACMAQLLVNGSTGEALPARVRIDDASSCNGIDSERAVLGTPQYFQQAYDLGSLASTDGASSTVAIVDAFGYADAAADLATYRNCFGLPAANLDVVNQDGSSDDLPADPTGDETGWELEQALDLDAVSSVCPLCHIILVQANSNDDGDLLAGEHTAASLGATVISNSWSGGGRIGSDSDFAYPGVATTAAAGDFGYLPNPPYVDYPAAYPDVTAVGGTDLFAATTPNPRGINEVVAAEDSSGCSSESKPSWQTDTGCPGRVYNDISADGSTATGIFFYDPGLYGSLGSYDAGGSSLSTALVAGYYGLLQGAGLSDGEGNPSWAYNDRAALNPVTSGSNDNVNGSCSAPILYVCTAGSGYNGPSGNGTISGDVVVGAPGIAGPARSNPNQIDNIGSYVASTTPTTVTLDGGVYPNQLDTTYWVQYGATSAYGQNTTPVDVGSGSGAVAVTSAITGLVSGDTYHYRLVAENSDGTSYGYDYTMSPLAAVAPTFNGYGAFNLGVASDSATPTVSVNSNQFDTTVAYEYGTSPSDLSLRSASVDSGASATAIVVGVTLTGLTPNTTYYVRALATNSAGTTVAPLWESFTTAPPPAGTAPVNSSLPVISGNLQEGDALEVTAGAWSGTPAPTFTYRWQDCDHSGQECVNIPAAGTGSSYTTAPTDVGSTVDVVVTASNSAGVATATSAATAPVNSPPSMDSAPAISGSALVGGTLSTTDGTWLAYPSPGLTYQWQLCDAAGTPGSCTDISRATTSDYTLITADAGLTVRAIVTATNAVGDAHTASNVSSTIGALPANVGLPSVAGSTIVGNVLSAAPGTWTGFPTPTYVYQWQHSTDDGVTFTNIPDADANNYTLGADDVGALVRVQVTASNDDGSTAAESDLTGPIGSGAPASTTAPQITGTPTRGDTLTASAGEWSPAPHTYAYQWERSRDHGLTWTQIEGATGTTYTPDVADEHAILRIVVSIPGFAGVNAPSEPTAPVHENPPVNIAPPTAKMLAANAQIALTASPGRWDGAGDTFLYRWQTSQNRGRTWRNIPGADSQRCPIPASAARQWLRVIVTARNPDGRAVATSARA